MSKTDWSQFIHRLLSAFRWPPGRLTVEAGVSPSTVSSWMDAEVEPRKSSIMKVLGAIEASTLEEANEMIDAELKDKNRRAEFQRGFVRHRPKSPDLEELLQVIQFLQDPDNSRRHLIADIESFEFLRQQALEQFNQSLKIARLLYSSIQTIEERTR